MKEEVLFKFSKFSFGCAIVWLAMLSVSVENIRSKTCAQRKRNNAPTQFARDEVIYVLIKGNILCIKRIVNTKQLP